MDGTLPPMIAADLDLVNMFGSAEWDSIRQAICDEYEEIKSWTEWHHEQPTITVLPSGEEFASDRGADQGDGFGSLQSGSVLARHRHAWASTADGAVRQGACDEWYIDDCQAFVRPDVFDPWLRAAALAKVGATRGTIADDTAKVSCRLLCRPETRESLAG